ncbi:putative methyltransferase, partial [Salmonella enterica subsp. enterica serovar Enteritidis str. 50-5646]
TPTDCWNRRVSWRPNAWWSNVPIMRPPLADVATPNAIVTKGHRFDIYAGTPLTE